MKVFDPVPPKIDSTAKLVAKCATRVHKEMGPGLLERVYTACLVRELEHHGLNVLRRVPVPLVYDGETLEETFYVDLLVEGHVIVEIRAVPAIAPIHEAQMMTHLKLTGKRMGLLINFNAVSMKKAIRRFVV